MGFRQIKTAGFFLTARVSAVTQHRANSQKNPDCLFALRWVHKRVDLRSRGAGFVRGGKPLRIGRSPTPVRCAARQEALVANCRSGDPRHA